MTRLPPTARLGTPRSPARSARTATLRHGGGAHRAQDLDYRDGTALAGEPEVAERPDQDIVKAGDDFLGRQQAALASASAALGQWLRYGRDHLAEAVGTLGIAAIDTMTCAARRGLRQWQPATSAASNPQLSISKADSR